MNELNNNATRIQKKAYNYLYEEIEQYFTKHSSTTYNLLNSIEKRDILIKNIITTNFNYCTSDEKNDIVIYLKSNYFSLLKQQKEIFEEIENSDNDIEEDGDIHIGFGQKLFAFLLGWFGMGEILKK